MSPTPRVFPGLSLPLPAGRSWRPAPGLPRLGDIDNDRFTAGRTGVTALLDEAGNRFPVAVPGEPVAVTAPTVLALDRIGDRARLAVFGRDRNGFGAPIRPGDLRWRHTDAVRLAVDGDAVTVTACRDDTTTRLTAVVAGHPVTVTVTVGRRRVPLPEPVGGWRFAAAWATGALHALPTGLRLSYDFTGTGATRAGYAVAVTPIPLPGRPTALRARFTGEGRGEWPSALLLDADGTALVLRGEHLDRPGARDVVLSVPSGARHPLRLARWYLAETDPAARYVTTTELTDPVVELPPDGPTGTENSPLSSVTDPLIGADVDRHDWRFAMISDTQFVARDPDGPAVAAARRSLREIAASDCRFLLINGDFVDEGGPADLRLAHRLLREELGGLPWRYLPGNHEVMGGSLDRFVAEFGPVGPGFDHAGVRFVTLDGSALRLGPAGLARLRDRLADAATDERITAVVVVCHVPPRDPLPGDNSRLTDVTEAARVESMLAEFGWATGKGAVWLAGHVGAFAATRHDGVGYYVGGNSGKTPAAAPGDGGFLGWTRIGVTAPAPGRPAARRAEPFAGDRLDWITVAPRPWIDRLLPALPDRLAVGATASLGALTQDGRTVPLRHPVPVAVRLAGDVGAIAARPEQGTVTGLRSGRVRLTVEVADHRFTRTITVVNRPTPPGGKKPADAVVEPTVT